jgi:DHA2 family lincomycin resistance protein-like MFS transporter
MTATAGIEATASAPTRDRLVIGTLLVAAFVVILNETIMGVTLPRLMAELGVTAGLGQWLTTAFMLTMAVVIPTTGFLLQRLSTRTVYGLSLGLFSAGTALATVAPGFWVLLAGRIVQASGTALMLPLLMTSVLTLVPPRRRGVVMGNISIVISVAPAIGPTLSGLILQFLSWRFMFGLVLPIAVLALVIGLRMLPNINEPGQQAMDLWSVLLTVPAFGGIVFGLSRLGEAGGSTPWLAPVSLVVGSATLAVFLLRQRALERGPGPLLDLRVLRYPMYRLSLALLCLAMTALFGTIILLPIYLQNLRGLGSLATGLLLLPGGLLMGLAGPVVGRLFDRYGPRVLTVPGAALLVVCMLGLTQVGQRTPVPALLGLHLIFMLGLALLFTPSFTTGLNPLPPNLYSHGSAIITTLQQVAGAAGTALLVTIMTWRSAAAQAAGAGSADAQLAGLHAAFGTAAGIAAAAVVLSTLLRSAPAEEPTGPPADADPAPAELHRTGPAD